MKKRLIQRLAVAMVAIGAIGLTACNDNKYCIDGTITDAADSTLYLEHLSLNGPVKVDSVRLKADGTFHFAQKAAPSPEFYRLRIANQTINLSADSTETVTVTASYPTMANGYSVEGSENCSKIRELALRQMALQSTIQSIARDPKLGVSAVTDSIDRVIETYKDDIKRNYIFAEPMKPYAYFALFQTVNLGGGQSALIFSPRTNPDDVRVYAAVATSWDTYYPNSERGENLHNIAIQGLKDQRIIRNNQLNRELYVDTEKVNITNIVDIALPDSKGQTRRLTDLKGRVVLLDFSLYGAEGATTRIMALRELYNKYHAQGFEIYQVGFDPDEHFWKTQTAALPWTCVYDADGVNSINLARYNVMSLPTFFLIQRDNSVHKRDVQIDDIDREIRSLL